MSRGSKVLSGTDKRKAAKAAARRGNAAYDAQDLETAIACYRESTAADPNLSADVWMTLGYAIGLSRGTCLEEIPCYEHAIRLNSNHDFAHAKLADVLQFVRGDFAGAEAGYKEAIRIAKGRADPAVHLHYGMLLRSRPKNKDLRGAEREYKTALKLDEGNADAHNNLGDVVVALRDDLEQAARHYRAALARDADHPLAGWNLFVVLERQGDLRGAADALRSHLARGAARGTDADRIEARERLEELEAQLGPGPAASAVPAAEAKPADGDGGARGVGGGDGAAAHPDEGGERSLPSVPSQDFDRPRPSTSGGRSELRMSRSSRDVRANSGDADRASGDLRASRRSRTSADAYPLDSEEVASRPRTADPSTQRIRFSLDAALDDPTAQDDDP